MSLSHEEKEYEPKKGLDYERNVTNDFIEYKQNTHKTGISNSVGVVLRKLSEKYFVENTTNEYLDDAWQSCVLELRTLAGENEFYKNAIDCIVQKSNEIDINFDSVSIHLPTTDDPNRKEKIIFPLKDTLILVLKALKDDAAFSHNYEGSSAEKLEKSKKEQHERLNNLLNCLNNIAVGICNAGVRNDLVFLLNKTYVDVDLIEDERSTVISFFKDRIQEKFWEYYEISSLDKRKELNQALMEWMSENDPTRILKLVDPGQSINKELHALFVKHGVDPKDVKLDDLINEAMPNIAFSCDPVRYPIMYKVSKIFEWRKEKHQPDRNNALRHMKAYMRENCPWENPQPENQKIINDFYHLYAAHKDLEDNNVLLKVTWQMTEELEALKKTCDAYFKSISESKGFTAVDDATIEKTQLVKKAIHIAKEDGAFNVIENFFKEWFYMKRCQHWPELRRMYSILMNQDMRQKIILSDKMILSTPVNPENDELILTPYLINRVFLHAILTDPQKWSNTFKNIFYHTYNFVRNNFDQDGQEKAAIFLKRDSYPEILLAQLEYLQACAELSTEGSEEKAAKSKRPGDLILFPDNFKTLEEWLTIANLLSEKQLPHFQFLYILNIRMAIKNLGEEELRTLMKNCKYRLDIILFLLPNSERKFFLEKLGPRAMNFNSLHRAIESNHPIDVMEYLVPNEAYANAYTVGVTPICHAASLNRAQLVMWLAGKGGDPNKNSYPDEEMFEYGSYNAIHVAAEKGFIETLKALKKVNANFEALDGSGKTVAHYAIKGNQVEVIRLLKEEGFNFNKLDQNGQTFAHYAAERGCIEILKELKEFVDQPDWDGQTPAHYAAREGHLGVLQALKEQGVNLYAQDNMGQTPADCASSNEHSRVREWLDSIEKYPSAPIEAEEKGISSAGFKTLQEWLQIAISLPEAEASKLRLVHATRIRTAIRDLDENALNDLLKQHSNRLDTILLYLPKDDRKYFLEKLGEERLIKCLYDVDSNKTLLETAIENNRPLDVIQWLDFEGEVIWMANNNGLTLIERAVMLNRVDVVLWLVEKKGINIERLTSSSKFSLVHFAVENGSVEMLKVFKKLGANFNQEHPKYGTPALMAAKKGYAEILELLQKFGVPINRIDECAIKALVHYAIDGNHIETLRVLKKLGVDFNPPNFFGETLAHYAVEKNCFAVLPVLSELGVDLNQADSNGVTPADLAKGKGHLEALKVLQECGASSVSLSNANDLQSTGFFAGSDNGGNSGSNALCNISH